MHHRHEIELNSFRHVKPMNVDVHKLPQTPIELSNFLVSRSCIQETL